MARRREVYGLIHGGLGNQLAQIAMCYVISKETKRELYYDKRVMGGTHSFSHDVLIWKILKENFKNGYVPDNKCYIEYNDDTLEGIIKFLNRDGLADRALLLSGLMHNWKYFSKYRKDIFNLFKDFVPDKITEKKIGFHFRLGDYLYYLPDIVINNDYIHGAIQGMLERGAAMEIDCFTEEPNIACERIAQALEIEPKIKDIKVNFIHGDDLEDFKSMSGYEYFISSLSSFSWWANFLGMALNENRTVCLVESKDFEFSKNQFVPN